MISTQNLPTAAFMARILSALQVEDKRLTRMRRLPDGNITSGLHRQWQASARFAARESKRRGEDVAAERSPHERVNGYQPVPMRPLTLTEFAEGVGITRRVAENWRTGRTRFPDTLLAYLLANEEVAMTERERAYWPLALLGQYEGAGVLGDAVRAAADACAPADWATDADGAEIVGAAAAGTVGALVD